MCCEGKRYRTKQEMIEYFKTLAYAFRMEAARVKNTPQADFANGKAEAYEMAAFELEHNMEG